MSVKKKQIIVMTPVKNESWILDKFLSAASLWADHIIVADQNSTDGSNLIAEKYPKVKLICNKSLEFNEPERQKLLLEAARNIDSNAVLIALDADEFISGDAIENGAVEKLRYLNPGTIIKFNWPFVSNDFTYYWGNSIHMPFGYVDDGAEHHGCEIHSPRVPTPKKAGVFFAEDIPVLHFQFTDWDRMQSKHRWYQCYERKQYPKKSVVKIFRMYSHMYRVKESERNKIPDEYFSFYIKNNINIKNIEKQDKYYWDQLVSEMVSENPDLYSNIDINNNKSIILSYLRATKKYNNILIKIVDKFIGLFV